MAVSHPACECCDAPFMGPRKQRFCSISCARKTVPIGPRTPLAQQWPDEVLERAFRKAQAGLTLKQIAVEEGGSQSGLGHLLKERFGYVSTPFRRPTLSIPDNIAMRAYIAGLVDGEGSIMFLNKHWCAKIGMTDEPVIRWLASFGGLFSAEKRPPPRKQAFYWSVHRRHDLIHLLTAMLPYLRVKHDLAERVLQEISLSDVRNKRAHECGPDIWDQ
jgi:hypothetical protein